MIFSRKWILGVLFRFFARGLHFSSPSTFAPNAQLLFTTIVQCCGPADKFLVLQTVGDTVKKLHQSLTTAGR